MREYEENNGDGSFSLQSVLKIIRAAGALLGVVAILIGLVYVTRMFTMVFNALHNPDGFRLYLEKWVAAIGGQEMDFIVDGIQYHSSTILAIAVIGVGVILLVWLSMALILAGAKTVSWLLSDRDAMRRLLTHAFGASGKPATKPSAADDKKN